MYIKLFAPVSEVRDNINTYVQRFSTNATVGMHIRRTDNKESIRQSPLDLFINKGKEELELHPNLTIFLATDSEEVKSEMKAVFGNRIVTSENEASRDSVEGICDGIVDLFTLASCQKIYGSAGSSFSQMAATISNGKAVYECLSL